MAGKDTQKNTAAKVAGIAATILWIVSIVLTFAIPIGNPFIWLGDALLLIGFWPLLWVWRPGWPWIVFGILNVFIGAFLEIAYFLPDTTFTLEMIAVRNHLRDQHSALTWMLIGLLSFLFGLIRTTKQVVSWFRAKRNKHPISDVLRTDQSDNF